MRNHFTTCLLVACLLCPAVSHADPTSTYTPNHTGAVSRTVQSKLDERVTVADFGADGQGNSPNDAPAIQAALDTGKTVVIPPGTYRITQTIHQQTNGQAVIGHGATIRVEADVIGWEMGGLGQGAYRVGMHLEGVRIEYHGSVASTHPGLALSQVYESTIERVGSVGFQDAVVMRADKHGCVYNQVRGCLMFNPTRYGLLLEATDDGWVNENLVIGGRLSAAQGLGTDALVRVTGGNSNRFIGVSIEGYADLAIHDQGASNAYYDPRLEGTWSHHASGNVAVLFDTDSWSNTILSAWYGAAVDNQGDNNRVMTPSQFTFDVKNDAYTTANAPAPVQFTRSYGNASPNQQPLVRIADTYASSGNGQALELSIHREWQADDYYVRGHNSRTDQEKFRITGSGQGRFKGGIGVGNSATASSPQNVVRKVPLYDENGSLLGYLPVYDAIQ